MRVPGLGAVSGRTALLAAGAGAVVATLGGLALWNRRRARRALHDHPPPGHFAVVDGVRLHYVDRGSGPGVLLLHGNLVTGQDFAASGVIDALVARGHRVVAIDRPGYGHSLQPGGRRWTAAAQADLLLRAATRLGLQQPIVLGHSWGALVALAMALRHPGAVTGLVLVSGYYFPTLRVDAALATLGAAPLFGDLLRHTVTPFAMQGLLPLFQAVMFGPRPVPPSFAEAAPTGLVVRPSQLAAQLRDGAGMVEAAFGMRDRYASLRLPVAILAGADDRVLGVQGQPVRLAETIPDSRLDLLPGHGHMLHYAAPGRVADAVEAVGAPAATAPAGRTPATGPMPIGVQAG